MAKKTEADMKPIPREMRELLSNPDFLSFVNDISRVAAEAERKKVTTEIFKKIEILPIVALHPCIRETPRKLVDIPEYRALKKEVQAPIIGCPFEDRK